MTALQFTLVKVKIFTTIIKILNKLIEIFIIFNLEKIVGINSHPQEMHDDIIGAHFESFNGYYYEGNHMKRQNYPEDEGYKNLFFFQLIDPYV